MFSLKGKVILVVGGRGYLGRDFCQKLREQEATVISADLPFLSKASEKSSYENLHSDIDQVDIDVSSPKSSAQVVDYIVNKYKKIDSLIYSVTAKPDDFYSPYVDCSLSGWQAVIKAELDGLFVVSQLVGKIMEEQEFGNMVFISSIYGVVGNDQRIYEDSNLQSLYGSKKSESEKQVYSHAVYPVVKGGIISLTRYLSAYWGKSNIRVNCVSPGGVQHEGENQDFVDRYSQKVPLGRKAEVDEVSGAIVYLVSDEASYVTGHNLIVDGGWTAW